MATVDSLIPPPPLHISESKSWGGRVTLVHSVKRVTCKPQKQKTSCDSETREQRSAQNSPCVLLLLSSAHAAFVYTLLLPERGGTSSRHARVALETVPVQ
uniref:Uncharacterized protein n=1 Tax=Knipowitschia caucasica TaxID=637954 RepID=A0AAV2MRQ9_KNICA